MTRFLQAAFPNSYFVVIKRHPVPVSMSSQRWKINVTSLHSLFKHWLHCHELFEEDEKYLKHVYELRYEDYVEDPDKYHQEIARFIGTRVPEAPKEDKFRYVAQWANPTGLRVPERAMEETSRAYNKKYFDRWSNLLNNSPFKSYYRYIAMKYESRFAKYGYALITGLEIDGQVIRGRKISVGLGRFCCLAADTGALVQRVAARTPCYIKGRAKAMLPEFLLVKIRRARQRASLNQKKTDAASPQA